MINPNNKELNQPKLVSSNWINNTDPVEAMSNFAKELRSESEKHKPQSVVGTEPEIEALNKSIETKQKSFEYLKQTFSQLIQPDPISNQSKPILDSVVESVNHPSHYQGQGGVECIDVIAALGHAEGFCISNCIKYLWRYQHKNGIEDLKKAQFYLNWYIDYLQKQEANNK